MERNIIATEALDARRQDLAYAVEESQKTRNATVFHWLDL
jgi:hypothetical protein